MARLHVVKPFALFLTSVIIAALVPASSPALAQALPAPTLSGVWEAEDGAYFRIVQEPGGTAIDSYMGPDDPCSGGPRDYVIRGTLSGEQLAGTIQRCDPLDHPLVVNCGLEPLWETTFTANVSSLEIVGEYVGEYYDYNYDSGGNITSCTLSDNPARNLSFYRVDCWVMNFEELAEEYIEVEAERPAAIQLAQQFEAGARLHWTQAQRAPGGIKEQVDRFSLDLRNRSYTVTVNSAYRPILYQAHFADIRHCALASFLLVKEHPELADLVAPTASHLMDEVTNHKLKYQAFNASGLTFPVPFVCKNLPLSSCPHVNEKAADISISPDNRTIDFVGALYGLCRKYVHASTPDKPHWDTVGPNPYGVAKCYELAEGHTHTSVKVKGNSPINLLLTDSTGLRVGFDPASGQAVNDYGDEGATYSGPGTQPQIIQVHPGYVVSGGYEVTGVGTGAGPYSITVEAVGEEGENIARETVEGQAQDGQPIQGLTLDLAPQYAPPVVIKTAARTPGAGGSTQFVIDHGSGVETMTTNGGGFTEAAYGPEVGVLGLLTDGSGGSATVQVPSALVSGDLVVHADGVSVTVTRTSTASGTLLAFDVPAGTYLVTIGGNAPTGGVPNAPPSGGEFPWLLVVGGAAAAAVAAAAVVLWRRRPEP